MPTTPARIVVSPDSFKESLPAAEVAEAIIAGLRQVWPSAEYVAVPMADGGEGTLDAITRATGATLHTARVTAPLGELVEARFCITADGTTAVIEMAAASGLELVPSASRDPLRATSYGTGELLRAALDAGVSRCVLGIGGSATVDGGAGMLEALGTRLLDRDSHPVRRGGAGLADIDRLDMSALDPRLAACRIDVACDVDNPLLGPSGAAAVFGPQKGATPAMVAQLELGLANLARAIEAQLGISVAKTPGGGAAGGVGAALIACLGANLQPGTGLVAELVGLDAAIHEADLVITGEGRMDGQTIRGKTPIGVAQIAKRYGKPVLAIAGSLGPGWEQVLTRGIDAVFPIIPRPCTHEQAFSEAALNLEATARSIAQVWALVAEDLTEHSSFARRMKQ